jgi:hypothetical protein
VDDFQLASILIAHRARHQTNDEIAATNLGRLGVIEDVRVMAVTIFSGAFRSGLTVKSPEGVPA